MTLMNEIKSSAGILVEEEIFLESISFFKLSKKIASYVRRAEGAAEKEMSPSAAKKFNDFVSAMKSIEEKVTDLEKKYDKENEENKEQMKKDYAVLKKDVAKKFKFLKDSSGRWLWAITDDPKLLKTFKIIKALFVPFLSLFGLTLATIAVAVG